LSCKGEERWRSAPRDQRPNPCLHPAIRASGLKATETREESFSRGWKEVEFSGRGGLQDGYEDSLMVEMMGIGGSWVLVCPWEEQQRGSSLE